MATFDVSFEGAHQASFETSPEAVAWAARAAATGRRVYVLRRGWLGTKIVAVLPPEELESGLAEYHESAKNAGRTGGQSPIIS